MKLSLILVALIATSAFAQTGTGLSFDNQSIRESRDSQREEQEDQRRLEWDQNPLSRVMTHDQYVNVIVKNEEDQQKKLYAKGRILTIDTRDQKECFTIKENLLVQENADSGQLDSLCDLDEENPYSSVIILEENKTRITFDNLSPENRELVRQTRNFGVLGVTAMGILFMLPESITKWNADELKKQSLGERWKEKVSEGPVVDKDDWMINYIGHPLSGAAYYTVARHAGAGVMKSFGYSVLMSTFFWEYGLEAFAETPSIQDLIITPIIGSLIGEGMFYIENKIKANGGILFGSSRMGAFAMGLMNPAGSLLDLANKPFESKVFKSSEVNFVLSQPRFRVDQSSQVDDGGYYFGINIEFKF